MTGDTVARERRSEAGPGGARDRERERRRTERRRDLARLGTRTLSAAAYVVVIVGAWSLYVRWADVPSYLLPAPGAVLSAIGSLVSDGQLWSNLTYTLRNIVLGFVGGSVIGVALGWALWSSRIVREVLNPYIVLLQAAPKIAVAPLLVLWFGLSLTSQFVLILLLVFFPMMAATMLGLRDVPADVASLGRLLNLSGRRYLLTIQIPAATPALLAGAKIAVIDAMTGAFLAEYLSAQRGLGYLMILGNTSNDTPMLIAAVLITVLVGLAGFGLVSLAERRLLRWDR
ncbi:ABC transporter permease [Actinomadura viridis]|uniref:NitT/TauT family transport system permease protein n=1 Tax=Actinomadura viridis TaxID=58110 RepID=A0A931DNB4_9ACTN|nr:ABC transporter permease [Actinomadura viridis]MBG6091794.1 NitT/TauT family transport system permease protein [Actinomadura viridis]